MTAETRRRRRYLRLVALVMGGLLVGGVAWFTLWPSSDSSARNVMAIIERLELRANEFQKSYRGEILIEPERFSEKLELLEQFTREEEQRVAEFDEVFQRAKRDAFSGGYRLPRAVSEADADAAYQVAREAGSIDELLLNVLWQTPCGTNHSTALAMSCARVWHSRNGSRFRDFIKRVDPERDEQIATVVDLTRAGIAEAQVAPALERLETTTLHVVEALRVDRQLEWLEVLRAEMEWDMRAYEQVRRHATGAGPAAVDRWRVVVEMGRQRRQAILGEMEALHAEAADRFEQLKRAFSRSESQWLARELSQLAHAFAARLKHYQLLGIRTSLEEAKLISALYPSIVPSLEGDLPSEIAAIDDKIDEQIRLIEVTDEFRGVSVDNGRVRLQEIDSQLPWIPPEDETVSLKIVEDTHRIAERLRKGGLAASR